jgi:hypothetical protein
MTLGRIIRLALVPLAAGAAALSLGSGTADAAGTTGYHEVVTVSCQNGNQIFVSPPTMLSSNGSTQTAAFRANLFRWNGRAWQYDVSTPWYFGTVYPYAQWQTAYQLITYEPAWQTAAGHKYGNYVSETNLFLNASQFTINVPGSYRVAVEYAWYGERGQVVGTSNGWGRHSQGPISITNWGGSATIPWVSHCTWPSF